MINNFRVSWVLLLLPGLCGAASAQEPWTWEKVRAQFEQSNPTLQAGKVSVDESKAQEITAYLRPNPSLTLTGDQFDPFGGGPQHGSLAYFEPVASVNYLYERNHKRELRL
jgi:cobalt-zinc-cadmium efflux system outer membrane protein